MQPAVGEYMTRPERPLMSDDPAAKTYTVTIPSTVSSTQPGEYLDMSGASRRRVSGAAADEGGYYETIIDIGAANENKSQYINMSIIVS